MAKDKILIVDCDENVRSTLFNCLSREYDVSISASLIEALEAFKNMPFNVVITDINTEEMQGIEVLRKFQELKFDIPIIVITTYGSVPLAVEAMKAGAYDYITKPFNFDELKMIVMHALERKKMLEELKEKRIYQELALLDGLTQIYNRRYFEELLQREVERAIRYPQKFSLLLVDIDNFKKYNDAHGHLAGDEVLKGVAYTLFKRSRVTDFVARFGGEEFCIIAPNTDKVGASILATRMVELIAKKDFFIKESVTTKVTVSIGVATFEDDAKDSKQMIQKADFALYQAKKLGKNRVCMFAESIEESNSSSIASSP